MYPPSPGTVLVAQQVMSKHSLDGELMVGFPCEPLRWGSPTALQGQNSLTRGLDGYRKGQVGQPGD